MSLHLTVHSQVSPRATTYNWNLLVGPEGYDSEYSGHAGTLRGVFAAVEDACRDFDLNLNRSLGDLDLTAPPDAPPPHPTPELRSIDTHPPEGGPLPTQQDIPTSSQASLPPSLHLPPSVSG